MNIVKTFFKHPIAPGILLFCAAVFSLVAANSNLAGAYQTFLDTPILFKFGDFKIHKATTLWINDGLMAIFFLLVGLEIKREFLQGHLSTRQQFMLPAIAALGGLIVPALIYYYFNMDSSVTVHGWAIPAATDIAFSLGVITLLGNRVPPALKVALVALAVMDDLAAIVIIALFYTSKLSLASLAVSGVMALILFIFNRLKLKLLSPYMIVGLILWAALLKSGIHATLAGVVIGFMIPMTLPNSDHSPLIKLEHALHPWVAFFILPLFAFANAGVSFAGMNMDSLRHPVTLGVAFGLFFGKQIGVMGITALCAAFKIVQLPKNTSWAQYYGMALLTGIGFTMSLFIGNLAFETQDYATPIRIGVLAGSFLSGILGYLLLRATTKPAAEASE